MGAADLIAASSDASACRVVRVPVSGGVEVWVRLRPPAAALLLGLARFEAAASAAAAALAPPSDDAPDAERDLYEARRAVAYQSRLEAEDVVVTRYLVACCDGVCGVDPDPEAPPPDASAGPWEPWRPVAELHQARLPAAPYAGPGGLPATLRARLYVEILTWLRAPVEVAAADARFRRPRPGDAAPVASPGDGLPRGPGNGALVGSGAPDPGVDVPPGSGRA